MFHIFAIPDMNTFLHSYYDVVMSLALFSNSIAILRLDDNAYWLL